MAHSFHDQHKHTAVRVKYVCPICVICVGLRGVCYNSAWNGRPWPGRSQNWILMYFIINLSGSQQFSGSSIQNQVKLSEWATGRFMHCYNIKTVFPGIPLIPGIWNYMTKTRWLVSVRLHFNIKTVFPGTPSIGNSITKTRWSHDHLSLNNGNSIIGMMGYLHWDGSYKLFDPIWQHLGHDELTSSNWLRQKRLPNWLSYYHWQHHR